MNNETKNPILYISGPGYTYEHFEPMISQINDHFESIVNEISFSSPEGTPVTINLNLDVFNPEKIEAFAKRCDDTKNYEVHLSAGLSYHVWLASRALASDLDVIPWASDISIIDEGHKGEDIKTILADFAYFLGSYYIILHEISHVALGHCDYVKDNMNISTLNEFTDEECSLSEESIRIRKAFEAEADRQAGEFLCAFFDSSLGSTGLGEHVRFPSREKAFEFYTYSISLVFVLLQQLTQRKGLIHPKPNERQYIISSSATKYLKEYCPEQHDSIMESMTVASFEAGRKLGLINADDPIKVMRNAIDLSFVDDVVKETNIRSFQLKLSKP